MTLEEKRQALVQFCVGKDCWDDPCPLRHTSCAFCDEAEYDEYDINRMYDLAFPKPKAGYDGKVLVDEEHDPVHHPNHYCQGGMECIDEMILVFGKATVADFCLCNVWKYRKRALLKNGQEDMDKADWYMNKYKELVESD